MDTDTAGFLCVIPDTMYAVTCRLTSWFSTSLRSPAKLSDRTVSSAPSDALASVAAPPAAVV